MKLTPWEHFNRRRNRENRLKKMRTLNAPKPIIADAERLVREARIDMAKDELPEEEYIRFLRENDARMEAIELSFELRGKCKKWLRYLEETSEDQKHEDMLSGKHPECSPDGGSCGPLCANWEAATQDEIRESMQRQAEKMEEDGWIFGDEDEE